MGLITIDVDEERAMLEIRNVSKHYVTGQLTQQALNDVSLSFRDNEFVSIWARPARAKPHCSILSTLGWYDTGYLRTKTGVRYSPRSGIDRHYRHRRHPRALVRREQLH